MKSLGYRLLADLLFVTHSVVVLVLIGAWWYEPLRYIHGALIILTGMSWLITGACILATWEFSVRQRHQPKLHRKPEYAYMHHYLSYFLPHPPSMRFMRAWGYVYLIGSVAAWTLRWAIETEKFLG